MLGFMAELLLRLRDRELSRTPIRNTRLTLGRDLVSDVVIDNAGVSRTHAILIYVDEHFRIRDGSQSGLTVNGKTVKDAVLSYGDVIGIGKFEIVLRETADALPLQAGSHADEASAKQRARSSAVNASVDTVRPLPPKPGAPETHAVVDAPPVAQTDALPSGAGAPEGAAPPTVPQAVPARPARRKPGGIDFVVVLKLAGIGLALLIAALGAGLWMLEHGML